MAFNVEQNVVRVKLKIAQVSNDTIKVVSKMETLLQTPLALS
jgi:hypothetical protein